MEKFSRIKCDFHVVEEDNAIIVAIGENVVAHENVKVTMDCKELIDDLKEKGEENPNITWSKDRAPFSNHTFINVYISHNKRYCIISPTIQYIHFDGQPGITDESYTCRVCSRNNDEINCEQNTSILTVCGK